MASKSDCLVRPRAGPLVAPYPHAAHRGSFGRGSSSPPAALDGERNRGSHPEVVEDRGVVRGQAGGLRVGKSNPTAPNIEYHTRNRNLAFNRQRDENYGDGYRDDVEYILRCRNTLLPNATAPHI